VGCGADDLFVLAGIVQRGQEMAHAIDPRAFLVVGFDYGPGRISGIGVEEHRLFRFGVVADTLGGAIKLPMAIKRIVDGTVLKWFVGNPQKYGFPKPDYKLYESHPIVNSLVLYHAGHGDLTIRPDVDRFDGTTVHFKDGIKQLQVAA